MSIQDAAQVAFEAWASSPEFGLSAGHFVKDNDGEYVNYPTQCYWQVWQASRAAVVIVLPSPMNGPEIDLVDDDYEQFELHENTAIEVNAMRRECLRAIEAAGLRVKL